MLHSQYHGQVIKFGKEVDFVMPLPVVYYIMNIEPAISDIKLSFTSQEGSTIFSINRVIMHVY